MSTTGPDQIEVGGGDLPRWHAMGVTSDGELLPLGIEAMVERPDTARVLEAMGSSRASRVQSVVATAALALSPDAFTELNEPVPGLDTMSAWADTVREIELPGVPGRVRVLPLPDGVLGLGYLPDADTLGCAAWHDDCFVVVDVPEGLSHILVSYREGGSSALGRTSAQALLLDALERDVDGEVGRESTVGTAELRAETELEWFAFLGENTLSSHGSEPVGPATPPSRLGSAAIATNGRGGALVLRPWQWVGSRLDRPTADPTFDRRLAAHLDRLRATGREYLVDDNPEVPDVRDGSQSRPVVWVHGTVSTGLAVLPELRRIVSRQVLRYEHDTFSDIDRNGGYLADLLDRKLSADCVGALIIGHSRGGLVARVAAASLSRSRPGLDLQVLTLGTPHAGTPLVNAGDRAVRALVAMTTFGVKGIGVPDPATMLLKYLLRFSKPPSGIADMAVGSGWLRGLNADPGQHFALRSFGGDYERGSQPESAGVKALGRLHRLFEAAGETSNDLVVSVASATGRGVPTMLDTACGHFHYLADAQVAAVIYSAAQRQLAAERAAALRQEPRMPRLNPP